MAKDMKLLPMVLTILETTLKVNQKESENIAGKMASFIKDNGN
jgi:hypothetical protein